MEGLTNISDLDIFIISICDIDDIKILSSINKNLYNLTKNNFIWKVKLEQYFPGSLELCQPVRAAHLCAG